METHVLYGDPYYNSDEIGSIIVWIYTEYFHWN